MDVFNEIFKILTIVFIIFYCIVLQAVGKNEPTKINKYFSWYLITSIIGQIAIYATLIDFFLPFNHFFYKISSVTLAFVIPFWILLVLSNVLEDFDAETKTMKTTKRIITAAFIPAIVLSIVLFSLPMEEKIYTIVDIFKFSHEKIPVLLFLYAIITIAFILYAMFKVKKELNGMTSSKKYFLYFSFYTLGFYVLVLLSTITSYNMSYFSVNIIIFVIAYGFYNESYYNNNFANKNAIMTVVMSRIQQPFLVCNVNKEIVSVNDAVKDIIPEFKYANQLRQKIYNIPSLSSVAQEMDRDCASVNLTIFTDECVKYLEASISCVLEKGKIIGYGIVIYDQTPLMIAIKKQKKLAEEDYLTNIYNRRTFMRECNILLSTALEEKENYAVLMLDIDNFKKVNDTYSHLAGDIVLVEFANKIKQTISYKMLFSRYGGEEFAIFLTSYNKESIEKYAEKLNEIVRDMVIKYKEENIKITVSIGISFVSTGTKIPFSKILSQADEALYESKTSGKDKYTIYTNDTL
ncbi:MAG: GGDEF domain-containing protein [Lachnospirales bacterium]